MRHRRGHPGPRGPPVHLRGVVGGPGLPRHHRHRVGRAPRRPQLPARGRRLHPRRGQRRHHPAHRPGRHHRRVDRAATPAGPGRGEARPERAHRRPVPSPHRAHLGRRAWSRSPAGSSPPTARWPRTPWTPWSPALGRRSLRCADQGPPAARRGAAGPGAGRAGTATPPTPAASPTAPPPRHPPGRPLRLGDAGRAGPGRRTTRAARAPGRRAPLPRGRGALRRRATRWPARWPTSSTGGPGPRSATPGPPPRPPRRVAELIGPELGWDGDRIAAEAEGYAEARRHELARAGLDPDPRPGPARPTPGHHRAGRGEPG